MRIAIIADTFPPLRTSGAVQLRDLSVEFARQGHDTMVLVADPSINSRYAIENYCGVTVIRLKTPQSKDVNYARRMLAELTMPFAMIQNFKATPLADRPFNIVVWYSPTIFLGPIIRWLKQRSAAKSYLILRDIFPQWAADMGIISRGLIYRFLDGVANYQYRSADVIGVQTRGNLDFFAPGKIDGLTARIEVLHNWLAPEIGGGGAINIAETHLTGRRIFVYAGNMGAAQNMDKLVNLAIKVRERNDVGFLFVGRGSEVERLRGMAESAELGNILFEDEIDPAHIPGLYAQCHVGMICLDGRHKTHNIPGKFLSYMQAGLPVLASINAGNDLQAMIEQYGVGRVSIDPEGNDLSVLAAMMIENDLNEGAITDRCKSLAADYFSTASAVKQVITSLEIDA